MKRLRRGLARVLLLAAACLVAFLLGEALVRLFLPPPEIAHVRPDPGSTGRREKEGALPQAMRLQERPADDRHSLYVRTPAGKRLRAGTVAIIENHRLSRRDVTIRTNALGYRNPEIGAKARRRVLFLGDSILLGDWLNEEETLVRRVEELSLGGPEPLETINAAVGGVGLENELAILLETGIGTSPDVVVLGFYLNDVAPSPGVRVLGDPPFLGRSHLVRRLYRAVSLLLQGARDEPIPWEMAQAWFQETREQFPPGPGDPLKDPRAFNRAVLDNFGDWGSAWSEGAWTRMEPILRELRRQADLHGFRLAILVFPVRQQVEAEFVCDHPQSRLREIAGRLEVPLLDLLPLLREAHRRADEPLFHDTCHHTVRGNRILAEAVLEFLEGMPPAS